MERFRRINSMTEKKQCSNCDYYFERYDEDFSSIKRSYCQALPVVKEIYRVKPCIYYKEKGE
jgi:hypothetical protein